MWYRSGQAGKALPGGVRGRRACGGRDLTQILAFQPSELSPKALEGGGGGVPSKCQGSRSHALDVLCPSCGGLQIWYWVQQF